ncbi:MULTISPECIES: hypothetical protein [unclassified Crossiella]|uniref:hypothetical protein n=1 Tax=unclassified Crossiella TaxID=2620835 RepID=UPI001FFF0285|nr:MULTISPECIES: hypothetical protein [unclassified Crossiella]MCK2236536.1 hypothetical protein [Crossiella sp. S99.2]MCK2250203.1 hypothetical protein [Crossiella sp. S99.1]
MSHYELSDLDHAEARDLLARALGEEPSMKIDPQSVLGTAKRSLRRGRALLATGVVAGVLVVGFGTTAIAGGFGTDSARPAGQVAEKAGREGEVVCQRTEDGSGPVVQPGGVSMLPANCWPAECPGVWPGKPGALKPGASIVPPPGPKKPKLLPYFEKLEYCKKIKPPHGK